MTDPAPDRRPTGAIHPLTWIDPTTANTTGWQQRHRDALLAPTPTEAGIIWLLAGWIAYVTDYRDRFGGLIGEDSVLGLAWARAGAAIRDLLNGELGRLDPGTLATILSDNLIAQGFDPDTL